MRIEYIAKPISGRTTVTFERTSATRVQRGADWKHLITGIMRRGERTKEISLLERDADSPRRWIENWRLLKSVDHPVPPTLRQTPEGTLLATNLRANGGELYGKGMANELTEFLKTGKPIERRKIDDQFLTVIENQLPSIRAQAQALTDRLTKRQIVLPKDDAYELIVELDGSWQVMTVDLALLDSAETAEEAGRLNQKYLEEFIERLVKCQELLLTTPDLPAPPPPPTLGQRLKRWFSGSHSLSH